MQLPLYPLIRSYFWSTGTRNLKNKNSASAQSGPFSQIHSHMVWYKFEVLIKFFPLLYPLTYSYMF